MSKYLYIYDKQGNVKCRFPISHECIYHKELMAEEYIEVKFNLGEYIVLKKGDYIDTDFGRFYIYRVNNPVVSQQGAQEWQYDQKFHASWQRWDNFILFYDRQKGYELSWHLTQTPEYFLTIVTSNLERLGFGAYTYAVDDSVEKKNEMRLLSFEGEKILSAINKIAQAWETEWWIDEDNKMIHLGKCVNGSGVEFKVGGLITSMNPDSSSNEYATRVYAFGSDRNLTKNYRKEEDGATDVVEAVVEHNLKLPTGTDHIDAWRDMDREEIVESILKFDDIYPKRIGICSNVTTKEYTKKETDEETGEETKVKWNAYRFRDSDPNFRFLKDYTLSDQKLSIIFQPGEDTWQKTSKLAGMEFELLFNPDGNNEYINGQINPASQWFEVVRNENYGIPLPNDTLHPEDGDRFIIVGFDQTKIGEMGYIRTAERELESEARKKIARMSIDPHVYTCQTNIIRCMGYIKQRGDWVHVAGQEMDFDIGQRVILVNDVYFSEAHVASGLFPIIIAQSGMRVSRIRAFDKHLDNIYDCEYKVGESTVYSKSQALSNKIEAVAMSGSKISTSGSGGAGVPLITTYDTTRPEDYNAYSAKRTKRQFLDKTDDDVMQGELTLKKGATFGDFTEGLYAGMGAKIDAAGNAEVESLRVRSAMEVMELVVNRQSVLEGDQILAPGDTIESVEEIMPRRYRLIFREKYAGYTTAIQTNDILRGVYLDTSAGVYKTSWMIVASDTIYDTNMQVIPNGVLVSLYETNETPAGTNMPPQPLMNVARWGNTADPSRQTCFYLSSTEGRIVRLVNVNSPVITDANYASIFGTIPSGFLQDRQLPIKSGLDYGYMRGLITQDIIRTDYAGNPVDIVTGARPNLLNGTAAPWEWIKSKRRMWNVIETQKPVRGNLANSVGFLDYETEYVEDSDLLYWRIAYPIPDSVIKSAAKYTVSFDFEGDSAELDDWRVWIGTIDSDQTNAKSNEAILIGEDNIEIIESTGLAYHFSGVLTTNNRDNRNLYLIIATPEWYSCIYEIANLKLEEGEIETPWQPSLTDGNRTAVLRTQQWEDIPNGFQFFRGIDGEPYVDVVIYRGQYYYCVTTCRKDNRTPADSECWRLGDKVGMVATGIMLADYAKIKNLGVEHVETEFGGAKIVVDGGQIRAYGTANSNHPNIIFGIDESGSAVINFYDNQGNFLYNLGPNGLQFTKARAAYWESIWLYPIGATKPATVQANWINALGTEYSRYHSTVNAGVTLDAEHDGCVYPHQPANIVPNFTLIDANRITGYFVGCDINTHQVSVYEYKTAISQLGQQGATSKSVLVYHYTNGVLDETFKLTL